MIYFIPAWYKQNKWCENEQSWYNRRSYSEFDETIKQIQLFHRNVKAEYSVLLLSYAPNFRHFLHRQGIYRASYWSCFDAIQQVKKNRISVLSFHDLKWPSGIEFVYSAFAIIAFLDGKLYAKIEFSEYGNMISVDMYDNGVLSRRNYYDDRGFVSTTIKYVNGKTDYQDYLGEDGVWRIRQFFDDGHVEVNSNRNTFSIKFNNEIRECQYSKTVYNSLEEVIKEVFLKYIENSSLDDRFFVALHPLHLKLLSESLNVKNYVVTIFENRFDYDRLGEAREFLLKASYIITDSKDKAEIVKEKLNFYHIKDSFNCIIKDISPYDTRTDPGISQQLKVQNIFIPIDGISSEKYEAMIKEVATYLKKNEKARVRLFTRNTVWDYSNAFLNKTAQILEKYGFDRRWAVEENPVDVGENLIDADEDAVELRFAIDQYMDERNISKCVNEQRVILDIRNTVDVFMFVTAISKGVPRISIAKDEFLEHGRNGLVLKNMSQIGKCLSFYLDNMSNWNAAFVANYEIGQNFTTQKQIEAWKEILK